MKSIYCFNFIKLFNVQTFAILPKKLFFIDYIQNTKNYIIIKISNTASINTYDYESIFLSVLSMMFIIIIMYDIYIILFILLYNIFVIVILKIILSK